MPRPNIYLKLANRICRDVISYHDGWPLGSTRDLARHYDCAPSTIRKALTVLAEQGQIVRTEAGYVRKRPVGQQVYCKPYPAVALLSNWMPWLVGPDYTTVLLSSFAATIRFLGLPACLMPPAQQVQVIPGGTIVGPTEMRFSAMAFCSAAPAAMFERLVAAGVIVMMLDTLSTIEGVDSVAVDCEHEAARATDYLARLGHQHIGFVACRETHGSSQWEDRIDPDARRFSAGMLIAKQRLGLNASPDYHIECEFDATRSDAAIRQGIDRLWRLRTAPTALVCFDTFITKKVEQILLQRGLTCPRQVSLLARDMKTAGPPHYTTLASDPARMGNVAAEHLVNRIISPSSTATKLLFPSILIEGQTTAPVSSALQSS